MSDQAAASPAVPPKPAAPEKGRGTLAVVASVAAVVLLAGGGFATWRFLAGGGPRPDEVLPDSTFAVVSIDLDPSGGQKLEAIRTLRKFPSFREHTGVRPNSDVIRAIWERTVGKECTGVDYAKDVKPWIGQRASLAGVELDKGKPLPAITLQIGDKAAATRGLTKLASCAKGSGADDFGYDVGEDYVVISDSTADAEAISAAGRRSPLSQDASYQRWTSAAGGPGILTGYLSPRAGELLKGSFSARLGPAGGGAFRQLDRAIADFKGAGANLRFKGGGLELSLAGGGIKQVGSKGVGEHVGRLPRDTALALAGAVDAASISRSIESAFEGLGSMSGLLGGSTAQMKAAVERQTGLRLPDDVVTLLGESFSISVGGDAPADLEKVQSPADVPAGYLVRGDEARIKDVVDRVRRSTGVRLEDLPATFETAGGRAVLATGTGYARQLLAKGSLGRTEIFKDVVPRADESPFVLYLSLDNGWSRTVALAARGTGGKERRELAGDLAAFRALGASAWNEGSTTRALVRVTVK